MKCQECGHENTEGAWLCINCGAKLDRGAEPTEESAETVEEPSRFEPSISENLRRLREKTSGQERRPAARRRPAGSAPPPFTMPNLAGGNRFLGLPVGVWLVAAVALIIIAMVLGNLQ